MPTSLPKFLKLDTHISLVDPDANFRHEWASGVKWFKAGDSIELNVINETSESDS